MPIIDYPSLSAIYFFPFLYLLLSRTVHVSWAWPALWSLVCVDIVIYFSLLLHRILRFLISPYTVPLIGFYLHLRSPVLLSILNLNNVSYQEGEPQKLMSIQPEVSYSFVYFAEPYVCSRICFYGRRFHEDYG
jgi:hypothetical protein